jgi:hypothetical protein
MHFDARMAQKSLRQDPSGRQLEAVHKKIGVKAVFDLSATPF